MQQSCSNLNFTLCTYCTSKTVCTSGKDTWFSLVITFFRINSSMWFSIKIKEAKWWTDYDACRLDRLRNIDFDPRKPVTVASQATRGDDILWSLWAFSALRQGEEAITAEITIIIVIIMKINITVKITQHSLSVTAEPSAPSVLTRQWKPWHRPWSNGTIIYGSIKENKICLARSNGLMGDCIFL